MLHHFQLVYVSTLPATGHNIRTRELIVGVPVKKSDTNYSGIDDRRMCQKHTLNLGGRNLPSTHFDEFLKLVSQQNAMEDRKGCLL